MRMCMLSSPRWVCSAPPWSRASPRHSVALPRRYLSEDDELHRRKGATMGEWFEKACMGVLVDHAAERFGTCEALYYEGKRWSFVDLKAETDRVAKGLIALGVQPGEKVSLWMPNRPEWIWIMFAV